MRQRWEAETMQSAGFRREKACETPKPALPSPAGSRQNAGWAKIRRERRRASSETHHWPKPRRAASEAGWAEHGGSRLPTPRHGHSPQPCAWQNQLRQLSRSGGTWRVAQLIASLPSEQKRSQENLGVFLTAGSKQGNAAAMLQGGIAPCSRKHCSYFRGCAQLGETQAGFLGN